MKKYLIAIVMATIGCVAPKQSITKEYTILHVIKIGSQSLVVIQGIRGQHLLNTDTLKAGDRITITWLRKR